MSSKHEREHDLSSKEDFYKNFKVVKVRCAVDTCGKLIDVLKVISHSMDNWEDDMVLIKEFDESDSSITLSNVCVTSCENCELETEYDFEIRIMHDGKPERIEASENIEHFIYSDGNYELEHKGKNFKHDNFLEELRASEIVIFYDKSNFFGFDEPKILNGHFKQERIVLEDGKYYDVCPENTIIFENGVMIYNREKAKKMNTIFFPETDRTSEYGELDMVYPQNNKGIVFEDKVLIIPQTMIKTDIASSCNIYAQE